MTALAKIQTPMTAPQVETPMSIDSGMGVEMFSSGSIAQSTDMTSGGGTALFTTSAVSADDDMGAGGNVGLFTTSA